MESRKEDKQIAGIKSKLRDNLVLAVKKSLDDTLKSSQHIKTFIYGLTKENPQITKIASLISDCLIEKKLTAQQRQNFYKRMHNIPGINEFILEATEKLINDKKWITDPKHHLGISLAFDEAITRKNILNFINEHYFESDKREQTDSRPVRRMDSLARIFSLNLGLSACTSVTFYDGQLFISANVAKQGKQKEIVEAIQNRIQRLQDFINETREKNYADIESAAEMHNKKLISPGGNTLNKEVVIQALAKFTHAINLDNETFNENIKNIFSQDSIRYTIILPSLHAPNSTPGFSVTDHHGNQTIDKINTNLLCQSVKDIHAEQLMMHHLKNIYPDIADENLIIGISKLCCHTCHDALEKDFPNANLRGQHGQIYSETLNIFTGSRAKAQGTPKKPGPTAAHNSPAKTPVSSKIASKIGNNENSLFAPARKRLFSDHEDKALQEVDTNINANTSEKKNAKK